MLLRMLLRMPLRMLRRMLLRTMLRVRLWRGAASGEAPPSLTHRPADSGPLHRVLVHPGQ